MINEPEDIQNRVRNTLGPLQTLTDICELLQNNDPDSKLFKQTLDVLKRLDIHKHSQMSINKLILLAKAADMKINDKMFCIEDYIAENNIFV